MTFEVINTSAVKGIASSHSGYCDVLRTRGVPDEISQLLEPLNSYNEKLGRGRPACGVRSVRLGSQSWGVVSRVLPNGADYTGRSNRLAHHVIVAPAELKTNCPGAILAGYAFRDVFTEAPRFLDCEPVLPTDSSRCAVVWSSLGGYSWCTHIADKALAGSRVLVLIPLAVDGRMVVASIVACLPVDRRWNVGVVEAVGSEDCWEHDVRVRVLAVGSLAELGQRSFPDEVVVDLLDCRATPADQPRHLGRVAAQQTSAAAKPLRLDFSAFDTPVQPEATDSPAPTDSDEIKVRSAARSGVERRSYPVASPTIPEAEPSESRIGFWMFLGAVGFILVGFLVFMLT